MRKNLTVSLKARGFDLSHPIPFEKGARAKCSQCEALVINGVACHETRCPNQSHECRGCNAIVAYANRYCEECC